MKNLYSYMIMGSMALAVGFTSCKEDEAAVLPTVDLAAMNFTHEPGEGEITLKWNAPADPANAGFMYMKMTYTDPRDKVTRTKTISPYTSEIVIPNTRARYGDAYSFTFTPYSTTDTPGTSFTLDKCKSNAAPATETVSRTKLDLTEEGLYTNAQEASEGPLANLINGNRNDFFHTDWHGNVSDKHFVDIDLGKEVTRFEIQTWNRSGNGNPPSTVELYRLSKLNDENPGTPFHTYNHTATAGGAEFQMMYPIKTDDPMAEPVRYLRYSCGTAGKFWNMAEMEIYEVEVNIFDPETDEPEVGE